MVLGEGDTRQAAEFRDRMEGFKGKLELGNGRKDHLKELWGFFGSKVFIEALGRLRVKSDEVVDFSSMSGGCFFVVFTFVVAFVGKDKGSKVSGEKQPSIRDFT